MKIELFHKIGEGGDESASVRKFIMDAGLADKIEFFNVMYEESGRRWAAISEVVPCLVADGRVIEGKDAIIAFLKMLK